MPSNLPVAGECSVQSGSCYSSLSLITAPGARELVLRQDPEIPRHGRTGISETRSIKGWRDTLVYTLGGNIIFLSILPASFGTHGDGCSGECILRLGYTSGAAETSGLCSLALIDRPGQRPWVLVLVLKINVAVELNGMYYPTSGMAGCEIVSFNNPSLGQLT